MTVDLNQSPEDIIMELMEELAGSGAKTPSYSSSVTMNYLQELFAMLATNP